VGTLTVRNYRLRRCAGCCECTLPTSAHEVILVTEAFAVGLRSIVHSQSRTLVICFSSSEMCAFDEECTGASRDVHKILLPLLQLQEMPEKFFAARFSHAEQKISESLLVEFGGDAHKLWAACSRLSGGHPGSAAALLTCLHYGPDSWAALLDRLSSKIANSCAQTTAFTAEEILRALSPSYFKSLGCATVHEWVRTGVMNIVSDWEHVLPAVMLLPFANKLSKCMGGIERKLAVQLQLLCSQLAHRDVGDAYEVFYSALLCLSPLVRAQEIQNSVNAVAWRACSVVEGLCGTDSEDTQTWKGAYLKETLTPAARSRRYDFTQDRTVRVYKTGELAGVSTEDLERHVWIPVRRRWNAGYDALLFFREAGTGAAGKLTPVVMGYKHSGEIQYL
jgi:hypothetical protein